MTISLERAPSTALRPLSRRRLMTEQVTVVAGQLGAGAGNLIFSVVTLRLLAPGAYAELTTFVALYLLLHVPAASLSAGSALAPADETRLRRTGFRLGTGAGVVLAAASVPLSSVVHLSAVMLLVLAAAGPGAGLLALARGRLYGASLPGSVALSLLTEPIGRLTVGILLAAVAGPVGGAAGVVAAGYAALAVARWRVSSAPDPAGGVGAGAGARSGRHAAPVRPQPAIIAFLLLAVLQNQDLVWANALLSRDQAAVFAALSTIGGVAAFATATIPMVLLPRAARRDRGATPIAMGAAAAAGVAAVGAVAIAPPAFWTSVLGPQYAEVGVLAVAYVGAMAMLGVARVLVAADCAAGNGRASVTATGVAASVQAIGIILFHHSAREVAVVTLIAMSTLAASTAGVTLLPRAQSPGRATIRPRLVPPRPTGRIIAGITVAGLLIRLVASHSVWVDEAISIRQARLPFGRMITGLEQTDVHPPLYATLLWVQVHVFGASQLSVRLPSIIAGTLVVPMLYAAGRELYDRRTGIAAAALGAVAPFAVWYSQETRMYAFFLLFSVIAIWAQARALRSGDTSAWIVYTLASAGLLWTHYFAGLQVLAQQMVFVAVVWRRRGHPSDGPPGLVRRWLASLSAIAVLAVPVVLFALNQLDHYGRRGGVGFAAQTGGAGAAGGHTVLSIYSIVANGVWALWGYHSDSIMTNLVALWPVGMLLGLLLLGRGRSLPSALLASTVVIPVLVVFALGTHKENLFEDRYFIGVLPGLLILSARALTGWARTRAGTVVAVGLAGASLVVGLIDQQLNPTNPRLYDFQTALHHVTTSATPGDMIVYSPVYIADAVKYYASGIPATGPNGPVAARTLAAPHVFVVGSFLSGRAVSAQTGDVLAQLEATRRVVATFHSAQVTVWELR